MCLLLKILVPWFFQDWKRLGPPLAEWMLQVRDKVREEHPRLVQHLQIIERSLSAFKAVDKYSEASMWGKLVPMS